MRWQPAFYFKPTAEGNPNKRGAWQQLCAPFQQQQTHGCSTQLWTGAADVMLTQPNHTHTPQLAAALSLARCLTMCQGWLLAGDKVLSLWLSRLQGHHCHRASQGRRRRRRKSRIPAALAHIRAPCSAALETAMAPSSEEACTVPSWHLLGPRGSCWEKKIQKEKSGAKNH